MKIMTRLHLFAAAGSILFMLPSCNLLASTDPSIALGASGTIITTGDKTADGRPILKSLLPDGTLNTPFAMAQETSAPEVEGGKVLDLVVLPDGSIVQAGAASNGTNITYLFIKTFSGGLTDTAFGTSGVSQVLQGSLSTANSVVDVLGGSGLVGVGRATVNRKSSAGLVLLNATGGNEIATESLSLGSRSQLNAVTRASATAAVAAAGWAQLPAGMRGLLTQYLVSPTSLIPDLSFGLSGSVISDDTLATLYLDLDVDTGGNLVVLGLQECDPIVRRYSSSGLLDLGFGLSGTVSVPDLVELGLGVDLNMALNALQLQADDRIVLVGRTADQNLLTLRLLSDGSAIDSTFSSSGVCIYNSSLASVGTDLAIDLGGNVFIAAPLGCPNNAVFKLNASGMLDLDFGINGIAMQELPLLSPVVVLEERQPPGTNATGGFSAALLSIEVSAITRALNSIVPPGGTSRVQFNPTTHEFTIQPGFYLITAEAPAQSVLDHKIFLEDITNGVTVALGTAVGLDLSLLANNFSTLSALIAVTAETTFRLQHAARVAAGLVVADGILDGSAGLAADLLGLDEIFARLTIQEISPVCPLQASSQCATQET